MGCLVKAARLCGQPASDIRSTNYVSGFVRRWVGDVSVDESHKIGLMCCDWSITGGRPDVAEQPTEMSETLFFLLLFWATRGKNVTNKG